MFDRINQGLWWDEGLSVVEGCTPMGCTGCWAAAITNLRQNNPAVRHRYQGLVETDPSNQLPIFNGKIRIFEKELQRPLKKKEPTAFSIWNDLFHEQVPNDLIETALHIFSATPEHVFFILTQRIQRASAFLESFFTELNFKVFPPPNILIGTTIRCQEDTARLLYLTETPAAYRFISIEPLLENINIPFALETHKIHGIIIGGPRGRCPGAMNPEWVDNLIEAAVSTDTKVFFKSWGNWSPNKQMNPLITPEIFCERGNTFEPMNDDTIASDYSTGNPTATPMYRVPRGTDDRLVHGKIWNELPL